MPNAVIIDDQATSRMIIEELVRSIGNDVVPVVFESPSEALAWIKGNPTDLILADYKMPEMDGVRFCYWLRQIPGCADIPIIVITCVEDRSVRYRALEAGATDFLTKPLDHHECRARCRNLLALRHQQKIVKERARWLERRVEESTAELQVREYDTLARLARVGEYRDETTGNHVLRMARIARLIGGELGLSETELDILERAAPLHDIGKIGIPDAILLKPGPLTDEEWVIMRKHSRIGHEILKGSPSIYLRTGAEIALRHHEWFNGQGYPDGLRGEEIPRYARIVAVADAFDALTSERPYKRRWPVEDALKFINEERGRRFDPEVVDALNARTAQVIGVMHEYPDQPAAGIGKLAR